MSGSFSYAYCGGVVMKSIIIVSFSIIAALIGAGFASGREILSYFTVFGRYGIAGIIVTAISFFIFIYSVFSVCLRDNIRRYNDFLDLFKSQFAKLCVKVVTIAFALAVYGAMLSALAELLEGCFNIPQRFGALISTVLATVVFSFGTERVFTFNGVIGLFLVFLITVCLLYILRYREFHVFSARYIRPAESGLIYSGYNLVSLTPVLITLSSRLKSKTDITATAITTSVLSLLIMGLMFCLISMYANRIELGSMPMLTLARRQNDFFAILYSLVLSAAIITTLLSSGGGLIDALGIRKKPLQISAVSAVAFLLSGLGFSKMIDTAYRICGIAGFFVCFGIVFVCFRRRKSI